MLNTKSFLAVDFGAGSLKLAEFEINEAGGLCLKNFSIKPLGLEGAQESSREATTLKALREVLVETGTKARDMRGTSTSARRVFRYFPNSSSSRRWTRAR